MRQHGSLSKDEETNRAAWVAARGAGVGAAKVSFVYRSFYAVLFLSPSSALVARVSLLVVCLYADGVVACPGLKNNMDTWRLTLYSLQVGHIRCRHVDSYRLF